MCRRNLTESQDESQVQQVSSEEVANPARALNWCPNYCGAVQMCHIMPTQCGQCPMCRRNLTESQDESQVQQVSSEEVANPARALNWCPNYCVAVQMCHIMPT